MRIPDIFRLNDWQIKKFILLILSILIAYDAIFLMNKSLFKIPILPQLLGFVVLTFIPGFIILKILRIHNIDRILNILLVIGLSMAFNTLFGLFLNGISLTFDFKPISFTSLFAAYNIILPILLLICYFINSDFDIRINENIEASLSQISLLVVIPSLAVLGTYLVNYHNINYINILLIIVISLIPFLYKFRIFHATLIWVSAVSILFSTQLISDYLWSWDIHFQYYVAGLVMENGYWGPNFSQGANSLLSIILLAPIYSILLDLDLVWVYKIIYPFFFSFVPLGVYYIAKKQFNDDRVAFFSPFVFMFYYGFFKDMIDKQFIAEAFLILTLIAITNKDLKIRKVLIIFFLFMLPLSHYGVSYLFLVALLFTISVIYLLRIRDIDELSTTAVMLFAVFIFSWYIYTSTGIIFNNIVDVGHHAAANLHDIFNPEMRSGMSYLNLQTPSLIWRIYKVINVAMLLFISFGIVKLSISYLKRRYICKNYTFGLIAIAFSCFLVYQIFATLSLAMDRSLQITLTVLAPFAVVGFMFLLELINKISFGIKLRAELVPKLFSLFLCIFFLFSSGLVHEVSKDPLPYAVALNKNPGWHVYTLDEVEGVKWIKNNGDGHNIAVLNPYRSIKSRDGSLVTGLYPYDAIIRISFNTTKLTNSYIFIGKTTMGKVEVGSKDVSLKDVPLYSQVLTKSNKIYSSGNAKIYLSGSAL